MGRSRGIRGLRAPLEGDIRFDMAGKKSLLNGISLDELSPEPRHIDLLRQEIANIDKRRSLLTGILQALDRYSRRDGPQRRFSARSDRESQTKGSPRPAV